MKSKHKCENSDDNLQKYVLSELHCSEIDNAKKFDINITKTKRKISPSFKIFIQNSFNLIFHDHLLN